MGSLQVIELNRGPWGGLLTQYDWRLIKSGNSDPDAHTQREDDEMTHGGEGVHVMTEAEIGAMDP